MSHHPNFQVFSLCYENKRKTQRNVRLYQSLGGKWQSRDEFCQSPGLNGLLILKCNLVAFKNYLYKFASVFYGYLAGIYTFFKKRINTLKLRNAESTYNGTSINYWPVSDTGLFERAKIAAKQEKHRIPGDGTNKTSTY